MSIINQIGIAEKKVKKIFVGNNIETTKIKTVRKFRNDLLAAAVLIVGFLFTAGVFSNGFTLNLNSGVTVCEGATIGDITSVYGAMSNPLVGYGIVVGLDGTGDQWGVNVTQQSIVTMLSKLGVNTDESSLYEIRDSAAVMVTAELPPFAVPGQKINVTVASIGNATSLQGGVLLMTPLKGPNGKVYALGQGSISVGGNVSTDNVMPLPGYIPVSENFQTAGIIDDGGIIEKGISIGLNSYKTVKLILKNPGFINAERVASAINAKFGKGTASDLNSTAVSVNVKPAYLGKVAKYISLINAINVKTHTPAIIVIDERSGTVVMGGNIRISSVAISNRNITIKIKHKRFPKAFLLKRGLTVAKLVKALNAVGASTSSIISILETIKAAGALSARIKVI
ncbi:MAG: flagellar basal body P-ring protein FlgI [Candidatus Acididesulfobacter guangdongensis]|uniref:Flagellar P-ring protein n=1 Tax=Acididesulfobacter guangdongensis TaxID=2597225 RepID=A0A519BFZ3_ACIG2|nr:MAG: flagellar basal body P-ring protein FlgI [Candidatus Acididesulfobacter guangdongensis]